LPQGTVGITSIVPSQDAWKAGLISTQPIDQIAAAQTNACSIEAGLVTCGGDNTLGQDAVPPTATDCAPSGCAELQSIPELEGAVQIAVSGAHGCAVMGDGTVRCWGSNDWGQLGHAPGAAGDAECLSPTTPVGNCSQHPVAIDGLTGAVEVAVGADVSGEHGVSCARFADGSVQCWGDNTTGAVVGWVGGGQEMDSDPHPVPTPIGLPGAATRIVAGGLSVCAIVDGKVICWGDDGAGQGSPTAGVQIVVPQASDALLEQVTDLAKGLLHTCAVSNGQVFCWGNNTSKQLGRDENVLYDAPCTVAGQPTYCSVSASPVAGLTHVVTLAAGSSHTCALLDDNSVRCWGSNINQQLGYQLQKFGDLDPRATPVKVQGLP
jgi:alpha-tubulin suppressor-like RCC1 family protein